MQSSYTAVVQQRGAWWIGWIAEIPGVNGQAREREDLLEDLRSALREALAMKRFDARAAVEGSAYEAVLLHTAG